MLKEGSLGEPILLGDCTRKVCTFDFGDEVGSIRRVAADKICRTCRQ